MKLEAWAQVFGFVPSIIVNKKAILQTQTAKIINYLWCFLYIIIEVRLYKKRAIRQNIVSF